MIEIKFAKDYYVDETGNVYSTKRQKKKLSQSLRNGYPSVSLSINGKNTRHYVHRLVAQAFIGDSSLQVNHKDLNRKNNNIGNLEYVTGASNMFHANDIKKKNGAPCKENNKYMARVTIDQKRMFLGKFNTREEVKEACKKAYKHYGKELKYTINPV